MNFDAQNAANREIGLFQSCQVVSGMLLLMLAIQVLDSLAFRRCVLEIYLSGLLY